MTTEKNYMMLNNFFKRKGAKIIIFLILLYIVLFCFISYLKYQSFSYTDIDLSTLEQVFWNTIHGKLIAKDIGEVAIFAGGHLSLIFFLLAPLYAINPHPLTLLFMQTIALALPAYFIYILARRKIEESFAFYFALAYLLYPALSYVNLFEFHEIAFAPLFLIPMFIFLEQKKFWPFVLFMFLSLACKEDVPLVIFGLGVYALFKYAHLKPPFIRRGDWRWIFVPLLSGALWFILATQFIQPYFTFIPPELKGLPQSSAISVFYGWLGSTPQEITRNIFLHPGEVARGVFIPAKNIYLLHLFGPLAFLSLFGLKEMLVVFFGLLESLLSQRPTHFCIYYQYPALIIPFIFISAIFGLARLLQFKFFKRIKLFILIILFGVLLFSAYKIGPLFKLPFDQWKPDERDILKERFIQLVPPDATCATTFELGTRLTHRDRLFFMYHINISDWSAQYSYLPKAYGEKADCLLIDFLDQLTYFEFYSQDSDLHLKSFLKKYNFNVDYEINNITLWTKAKENAGQLIETIDTFPEQLPQPSFSNAYIKLAGCQLKRQVVLGYPVLHLDGYLECQKPTSQRYILQLDFYSKDDKQLLYRHYFIAPDRIYPTKRWKQGEKIKISQNVLLPSSVPIENCDLSLNFCLVQ